MYEEAIKELTHRFGNPELTSKSLVNKLLELRQHFEFEDICGQLTHNIARTLKNYDHGADLKAAANMQLVIKRLLPVIAERWSRRMLELQP